MNEYVNKPKRRKRRQKRSRVLMVVGAWTGRRRQRR